METIQTYPGQRQCWGRTTPNLHRCRQTRIGKGRFFCHQHRKQPFLWLFVLVFTIGPGIDQFYDRYLSFYPPVVEQKSGEIPKATLTGFEQEAQDAAKDLAARATVQFKAAEEDYTEHRYKEAAERYQKSLALLSTMSAYLNNGNALLNISEFGQAETSYLAGLQLARKKDDKTFEAFFLGNIGSVYFNQGKYEEALRSHQDALALLKQLGNPLGQAQALNNIGSVYADQGKYEEALRSHQDALALHKQLGNPLGQAHALNNIGNVYFNQGKYKEALRSYQDALALHEQLGNPLGQAQALNNIGSIYAKQGKTNEAIEWLTQAQALYRQLGLNTRGLQTVERTLNRLRSTSKDKLG
jgi:tetratricopeptide (TPR) repeat protein